ncbi:MAG: DAK2 domain-containing protein [Ilumatobacteraceae bacterium]
MSTLVMVGVAELRATMTTYRDQLRVHQEAINRLNVYPVPDGDTGTNMARTVEAVVDELAEAPRDLTSTCDAISHASLMGARGNSGVILSQVLRGIASTCKEASAVTGTVVASALRAASEGADGAVLKPVEGTILTVVRASADGAQAAAAANADLGEVVRAARDAAREALARTPEQLPVLRDAGVVDAGGAGYVLLLDSLLHVIDGEPLPEPASDSTPATDIAGAARAQRQSASRSGEGKVDVSEQRYEVMYLCDLADAQIEAFKQRWGELGDSIVVVGGDGIWNCHVHTNDIGAAIEAALELDGRPHAIRVTDLFEEVAAEHAVREAAALASVVIAGRPTPLPSEPVGPDEPAGPDEPEPIVPDQPEVGRDRAPAAVCAVVAVASGPGITRMFRDLGVQAVVAGGQTLNPSTAELLAAVEDVNADQVVVLPGNKNIIPVAEQLDALTARTVRVVPTRSMPEGLAALMVYDPEDRAEANSAAMRHAAEAICAGEVTRAVRASRTEAGEVAEGDWIGIAGGDGIVAIDGRLVDASTKLLDHLVGERCELVTVIAGAEATAAVTAEVMAWVEAHRPGVEVEVHDGGQPLYPYLFGVE